MINHHLLQAMLAVGLFAGSVKVASAAAAPTPLHIAAAQYDLAVIQDLIAAEGADVNILDDNGNTPLHWAASGNAALAALELEEVVIEGANQAAVINTLLDAGATIDAPNAAGRTPLHLAVAHSYWPIVSTLLEQGANINAQDNEGKTPLHMAVLYCRNVSLITERLLIEEDNIDITLEDASNMTALDYITQQLQLPNLDAARAAELHEIRSIFDNYANEFIGDDSVNNAAASD